MGFNSRARVGATFVPRHNRTPTKFQFTRPGGRDNRAQPNFATDAGFNSRARVGATRQQDL